MENQKQCFALRGDIAYSLDRNTIQTYRDGYVVCCDGRCGGAFKELPEKYRDVPVTDYRNRLIIPGLTDLHVHAPQYTFCGTGMDLELLEWLNKYTFPEEARYADTEYARQAYRHFVQSLARCFTSRAVVFGTIHNESTIELMDQLEASGMVTYVGRVNMDRNGGEALQEKSAEASLEDTEHFLDCVAGRYENTYPILTPRFIPTCSDELMRGLGTLAKKRGLRLQSHLSENRAEIAWVRELVPQASCYANAYELFGAIGAAKRPAIMAHCVYSDDKEIEIMKKYGTYIAHCPDSNMNLSSGIAPVRRFLEAGIPVGLGTDVAAGSSLNMLKCMLSALQVSKLYYRLVDRDARPLTFEEVFYLASLGGGSYFGKVGAFQENYEFDAVVIDDSRMQSMREMSVRERMERMVYNDSDCIILDKYVKGIPIFSRRWV